MKQKISITPFNCFDIILFIDADAVVDNVYADGTRDDEVIYNIVLAPETVNGVFGVSTKTQLKKVLTGTKSKGDRIDVFSTTGWDNTGSVLIGDETITFSDKTVGQFIIDNRYEKKRVLKQIKKIKKIINDRSSFRH